MPRTAALLAVLLLGACSQPFGGGGFEGLGGLRESTAVPTPPRGERDPRLEACREQATRMVQWRDRGQLMRTDEIENRRDGNITVAPPSRAESDRLGATLERDRLTAECYRANQQPTAAAGGGAAPR